GGRSLLPCFPARRSADLDELFDAGGRPVPDVLACLPAGARRLGSTPHANGGLLTRELPLPSLDAFAVPVDKPGSTLHEPTPVLGDRKSTRPNSSHAKISY